MAKKKTNQIEVEDEGTASAEAEQIPATDAEAVGQEAPAEST